MRILVADDDGRVITLWREWLEGDDCTVSAASDGREAVKKAKEEKPDRLRARPQDAAHGRAEGTA